MQLTLTDGPFAEDLFPFCLTRSVADIRCGILSIRQKWEHIFPDSDTEIGAIEIPANVLPEDQLIGAIREGKEREIQEAVSRATKLQNPVDIVMLNGREIKSDFQLIYKRRKSQPVPASNRIILSKSADSLISPEQIFLEAGALVEHCILNASEGPIYIGKDALIMEGSLIRGPFALGEASVLKMGTRIYGATTIGPHCTVGGEIKNSVIFGYSNKAHEGYLGDSVIGEWCNLGAGTSNSNVRNNAGTIKLWNPLKNKYTFEGLKCGLFMGDYCQSAINTAFNTGTVVGACVNVFGKGLTPSYLPSFTWGFDPLNVYNFEKAIQHIGQWKKLKNKLLSNSEINRLKTIFDQQKNM